MKPQVNYVLNTQIVLSNFVFLTISKAYDLMGHFCADSLKNDSLKNKIQTKLNCSKLKHTCNQNN